MKQALLSLRSGKVEILEIPRPRVEPEHVLIETRASLISPGTERMLVEFGRANLVGKARANADKVRQVLDKVRVDGVFTAIESIRSKLDQLLPLGYCNTGIVEKMGDCASGIPSLRVGDRVVCNGPHAEVVRVPYNLCAKVPDEITDEEAAFTVVGAIGLQGIRLAKPSLGEAYVVTGLGLIGQLTVQLLTAHGCRVLGIDFNATRCAWARQFGAETVDLSKGEDPVSLAMSFSRGRGVDGVLITAATKSSEPVHQAAQMCRKRGRIVLIGSTGLELRRSDFYEKELSFQVSCSYGPGRYDPEYEEKGHDYPFGYVRWTEQRNFEAVLDLLAKGKLEVKPLISHRFPFEEAAKAFELITENKENHLGIILEYGSGEKRRQKEKTIRFTGEKGHLAERKRESTDPQRGLVAAGSEVVVGVLGAGNFTHRVLLPAMRKTDVRLKVIASAGGISGTHLGRKFGFEESSTDVESILSDKEINTVFVATRHNTHAYFVMEALKAGKHVFTEKPLCINERQLSEIVDTYSRIRNLQSELPLLMVGFNRRFAPHVVKMKQLLESIKEPKTMVMTVNAGFISADHWTQDPEVGGGRVIGEGCHYIDLLRILVGHPVKGVQATMIGSSTGVAVREDKITFTLSFTDGSFGTVHYLASGHKSFPKERLEVFCAGRILQLRNFKRLHGYGWPGLKKMNLWRQDKGHEAEVAEFIKAVRDGGPSPIPFEELVEVARVTFQVAEAVA